MATSDYYAFLRVSGGVDYSFAGLLGVAWRQFRRHGLRAMAFSLVGILLLAAAALLSGLMLGIMMALMAGLTMATSPRGGSAASMGVMAGGMGLVLGLAAVVMGFLLATGLLCAVIRTFDFGEVRWSEMWRGFKTPWRWRLLGFGALYGAAILVVGFLCMAAGWFLPSRLPLEVPPILMGYSAMALGLVAFAALNTGTLLVGPIILLSQRPRIFAAIGEYIRVLKQQPMRLMTVAAIYPVLHTLAFLPVTLMTSGAHGAASAPDPNKTVGVTLLCAAVAGLLWVPYQFLVAATYRAAFGLPMERERHSDSNGRTGEQQQARAAGEQ